MLCTAWTAGQKETATTSGNGERGNGVKKKVRNWWSFGTLVAGCVLYWLLFPLLLPLYFLFLWLLDKIEWLEDQMQEREEGKENLDGYDNTRAD